jgi:homocysteine S-methyltransferase
MNFEQFLHNTDFILGEGSLYERLRRQPGIEFDPQLAHASLIYDARSVRVLENTHREYLDIGQRYQIPMMAGTST